MPSPAAVLVFLFTALAGWCSLQQAELQAVREENRILAGRSKELDQLKMEMGALRRTEFASVRRDFSSR